MTAAPTKKKNNNMERREGKNRIFFKTDLGLRKKLKTRLKHKKYEIGKKNSRREIINATNLSLNLKTEQI